MKRRQVLSGAFVAGSALVAGCIGGGGGTSDGGNDEETTDEEIVENYGLPSCDSSDTAIQVTDASLDVGDEAAVVSVAYEFISGVGDEEEPPDSTSVSFQVTFYDSEGNSLGDVVDSGFVSTEGTIEEEFSYSGPDWEQSADFDLNITPEACA